MRATPTPAPLWARNPTAPPTDLHGSFAPAPPEKLDGAPPRARRDSAPARPVDGQGPPTPTPSAAAAETTEGPTSPGVPTNRRWLRVQRRARTRARQRAVSATPITSTSTTAVPLVGAPRPWSPRRALIAAAITCTAGAAYLITGWGPLLSLAVLAAVGLVLTIQAPFAGTRPERR